MSLGWHSTIFAPPERPSRRCRKGKLAGLGGRRQIDGSFLLAGAGRLEIKRDGEGWESLFGALDKLDAALIGSGGGG
jgi:hypothetical protein